MNCYFNFKNIRRIVYGLLLFLILGLGMGWCSERAKIVVFKVPGCPRCLKVQNQLSHLNPAEVEILYKDITERRNQELLETFEAAYHIRPSKQGIVPKVFVGESCLIGENWTETEIRTILQHPVNNRKIVTVLASSTSGVKEVNSILHRFSTFSWLTVGLAGLIDGINPCAMATLIFFISFLFFMKSSRPQIVAIGISFIAGTFLTYLLIGFGLLKAVYSLSVFPLFAKLLYPGFTLITLALTIYSIHDYWAMHRQKYHEVVLQLPSKLKNLIHRMIHSKHFLHALPVYGFVTGCGVSLVEFLCTGQVYLPTIVYILGLPEMQLQGVFYLILYNLLFIVPLVLTFIAVYTTFSADQVRLFMERHLKLTKIFLALFFLILTIYMAFQSWQVWG